MPSESAALSDFILPAIIESSEAFNARAARASFERACRSLAWQAYWLAVFEYLEKHQAAIEAVEFPKENYPSADQSMIPVPRSGADPKLLDKALSAAPKAFSRARGKFMAKSPFRVYEAREHAGASRMATLAERESIFSRALGPDVYRLRLASLEQGALEAAISAEAFVALSGRRARRGV